MATEDCISMFFVILFFNMRPHKNYLVCQQEKTLRKRANLEKVDLTQLCIKFPFLTHLLVLQNISMQNDGDMLFQVVFLTNQAQQSLLFNGPYNSYQKNAWFTSPACPKKYFYFSNSLEFFEQKGWVFLNSSHKFIQQQFLKMHL